LTKGNLARLLIEERSQVVDTINGVEVERKKKGFGFIETIGFNELRSMKEIRKEELEKDIEDGPGEEFLRRAEENWLKDSEGVEEEYVGGGESSNFNNLVELNPKQRRDSEELVKNLLGGFRQELDWVPCKTVLSDLVKKGSSKKLWIVKGLVLIRDDGLCRVCGERVRGQTWKVVKEDKEGRWEEENCFLLCKNCSLCHIYKEFAGSSRVEKFQKMKLFILKRRRKGVRDCDSLGDYGLKVLRALSHGSVDEFKVKSSMNQIIAELKKSGKRVR